MITSSVMMFYKDSGKSKVPKPTVWQIKNEDRGLSSTRSLGGHCDSISDTTTVMEHWGSYSSTQEGLVLGSWRRGSAPRLCGASLMADSSARAGRLQRVPTETSPRDSGPEAAAGPG